MIQKQALNEQVADLNTIGCGVAREKFAAELAAVLANINDPNTEPTAKRKVVLEFVFQPDDDREVVATLINSRSVLAATKPTSDVIWLGTRDGEMVATVVHPEPIDPRQGVLPLTKEEGTHA